jgi:hypothetical protein
LASDLEKFWDSFGFGSATLDVYVQVQYLPHAVTVKLYTSRVFCSHSQFQASLNIIQAVNWEFILKLYKEVI